MSTVDRMSDDTAPATALTVRPTMTPQRLEWSEEDRTIIRRSFLGGADDDTARMLMAVAAAKGLDPLKRQIHFVKRNTYNSDTRQYEPVWSFQTAIDGFRSIAESTGEYDGQDEYEFCHEPIINAFTGEPQGQSQLVARVRVYRKGIGRPFVGVARWREYVQTNSKGEPVAMWAKMPHNQLGKCAEAAAMRKAFPERLGGIYVDEEMQHAGGDHGDGQQGIAPAAVMAAKTAATAPAGGASSADASPAQGFSDRVKDWLARLPKAKGKADLEALAAEIQPCWANLAAAEKTALTAARQARIDALKAAKAAAVPAEAVQASTPSGDVKPEEIAAAAALVTTPTMLEGLKQQARSIYGDAWPDAVVAALDNAEARLATQSASA